MSGIKFTIKSEIGSFITQTFSENVFITQTLVHSSHKRFQLSIIVGRARKHLEVALASTNMKSSILQGARLNHPTNVYINEYLTQKRLALLYKLRVIKKDNPAIGSVYNRNGSFYYKLYSDKNKQYIVKEESDLTLIKSDNNDSRLKVTSSKKTTYLTTDYIENSQLRLNSIKYCFLFLLLFYFLLSIVDQTYCLLQQMIH